MTQTLPRREQTRVIVPCVANELRAVRQLGRSPNSCPKKEDRPRVLGVSPSLGNDREWSGRKPAQSTIGRALGTVR